MSQIGLGSAGVTPVETSFSKLQFSLKGFSESEGFRIFAFEGVAADRTRTIFAVRADLAMARNCGIGLQELPLLCRAVLERSYEGGVQRGFTYSQEDMHRYADSAALRREEAKKKKGPPRRPLNVDSTQQV